MKVIVDKDYFGTTVANLYYIWLDAKAFSYHLLKIRAVTGNKGNEIQIMDRKLLILFFQKITLYN